MIRRNSLVVIVCLLLSTVCSSAFLQTPPRSRVIVATGKTTHHGGLRKNPSFLVGQRWMAEKSNSRQGSEASTPPASDLSTGELLEELDRRHIRYAPTATRKDLERLLQFGNAAGTSPNSEAPDITIMVRALIASGVRLPPHASRSDLERLFYEHRQNPTGKKASPASSSKKRRKHKAIPRLLKELDALEISYPPQASPATLEKLLRQYEEPPVIPSPSQPRHRHRRREIPETTTITNDRDDTTKREYRTAELLIELNRRGIRFSPTATRDELDALLDRHSRQSSRRKSRPQHIIVEEDPVADKDIAVSTTGREELVDNFQFQPRADPQVPADSRANDINFQGTNSSSGGSGGRGTKRKMESKRSLWSKLYGASKKTVKQGVFRTIPDYIAKTSGSATTRLSRAAEKAARKARHATRSATDFFVEDENGIRDADFQYVDKSIPIDVPAVPVVEERRRRPKRYPADRQWPNSDAASSYRRASPTSSYYPNEQSPFRPQKRRKPTSTPSMSRRAPGSPRAASRTEIPAETSTPFASQSNLFRLPPAKSSSGAAQGRSSSKTENTSRRSESRRIYSPYDEEGLPSQVYRDSIDRFGEFVANATDNILWGRLDAEDESEAVGASKPKTSKKKRAKARSSNAPFERDQISWRDRVEERFDSMLGIHEEGGYYGRWAQQEGQDQSEEKGNDALSVARGRAPKRNSRHSRRNKVYDKPFWDAESAISSLFGRSPPAGYSGVGVGNLLPFIKTLAKSSVLFGSNACEWATVRGSLPQPVVVVGVTSCVLSARPGKRLLALAISLIAFRIFGELIHEGLYSDEDWEEHGEHESGED